MKKIIVLILCVLFLFGCSNGKTSKNDIEIGKTIFDNEVITFYEEEVIHHDGLITTNYLYYKTESRNFKNDGTLLSKDGKSKMYVDFYGEMEISDSLGNIVVPSDSFTYDNHNVDIYVVDTSSTYYVLNRGLDEYFFGKCVLVETTCVDHKLIELDLNQLNMEVNSWKKIDDYKEYASYKDFVPYMEIRQNKVELDKGILIWQYSKVELMDGRWVVCIDEGDRDYYLLDVTQVKSLKKVIGE